MPVSPSDLHSFCVADFMISGVMQKQRAARARPSSRASWIWRPVDARRSSPRMTMRHALDVVVDRRGELIRPVAVAIAHQQIAALLRRPLLLRAVPEIDEALDGRLEPHPQPDARARRRARDRGRCRDSGARA